MRRPSRAQRAMMEKPSVAALRRHAESMRKIGEVIRADNEAYKAKLRAEDAKKGEEE